MAQPKIFVSHSSDDTDFASDLVDDLCAAGADAWLDTNDLGAGNFQELISAALRECEWFVLVLTRNALASTWVRQEVDAANSLKHTRDIKNLIFVKAGPVTHRELPPLWRVYNVYDATTDYEDVLDRVLGDVGLQPLPVAEDTSSRWQLPSHQEYIPRRQGYISRPQVYIPRPAKGTPRAQPKAAIDAARQYVMQRTHAIDQVVVDETHVRDRARRRMFAGKWFVRVGDVVRPALRSSPDTPIRLGVVCATDPDRAYVSWYRLSDEPPGYWTDPEAVSLDILDLVDPAYDDSNP